jgi:hypothetical protein
LGRAAPQRAPVYPTYTPPTRNDAFDSYEAEKNKTFNKPALAKVKGMQLGKKSKTTDMFEKVRGEIGGDDQSPLIVPTHTTTTTKTAATPAEPRVSSALDRDAIHVVVSETIAAKLSRDGAVNSLAVSGDLSLRVSDPTLTKVKLKVRADTAHGAQFRTHPHIDRNVWTSSNVIQLNASAQAKGFPVNNSVAVLRWKASPKADDSTACPISFTVWINKDSDKCNITIEYELTGGDPLQEVAVAIPYQAEPTVSSTDAEYELGPDSLEWTIGSVDEGNPSGAFEFEAETGDENDFFPMHVRFSKTSPFINVDVASVSLTELDQEVTFSKEIKSAGDNYVIE